MIHNSSQGIFTAMVGFVTWPPFTWAVRISAYWLIQQYCHYGSDAITYSIYIIKNAIVDLRTKLLPNLDIIFSRGVVIR